MFVVSKCVLQQQCGSRIKSECKIFIGIEIAMQEMRAHTSCVCPTANLLCCVNAKHLRALAFTNKAFITVENVSSL